MADIVLEFSGDGTTDEPRRCEIDFAQIDALFESAPRPSVIVMKTSRLEKLLRTKGVGDRISALKERNKNKGLAHYFKGRQPVALNGHYVLAAKLLKSLTEFLTKPSKAGDSQIHFLGVSDDVFTELYAQSPDALRVYSGAPDESSDAFESERLAARPLAKEALDLDWNEAYQGKSREAREIRNLIRVAATSKEFAHKPVLILGPTGSGKEVVAKSIHYLGRGAAGGPLIDVNCAAISQEMFEAVLFGVSPGTATGVKASMGLWEQASVQNGTLLLNEVGDLAPAHQAKILRALEEGEVRRVGGRKAIRVTARVIADTNRDIFAMARRSEYREDLAYRLARLVIRVPNLAVRRDDIAAHAQRLWRDEVTFRPEAELPPGIISILAAHTWPGGVRELIGLLETTYAFCLAQGTKVPEAEMLYKAWKDRGDSPLPGAAASRDDSHGGGPGSDREPREGVASLDNQIGKFRSIRPSYERFAPVLKGILEVGAREYAPLAIVETRAKSVARVAEKLQREGVSVDALPDLCGGRVVVHTREQARALTEFLERHFEVDSKEFRPTNVGSGETGSGYHPTRLRVHLDRSRAEAVSSGLGVKVPEEVVGLGAEVEIRTVLEHAWTNVNHDMGHDVPLTLPARWSRELEELSRVLEAVDGAFSRIRKGFETYRTTYPAQLTPEQTQTEIEILENVLAHDPDPAVAVRLAKLAISIEDWDHAIASLETHAAEGYPPAMRDLGVALCQKHRAEPQSSVYQHGQKLLMQAAAEPHRDPDALASLAGTLKRSGQGELARTYYGKAHDLDPGDPYALWGLLEMELSLTPDVDFVSAMEPQIDRAIERCREQVAAGINLPWALFDLGKFLLLRGEEEEGIEALRRGVECSRAGFMVQTTIESLERIAGNEFVAGLVGAGRELLEAGLAEMGD